MIGWLKTFLAADGGIATGDIQRSESRDRVQAAAALMVEAAARDGHFSPGERATVERLLVDHFDLAAADAADLVDEVVALHENSSDIYRFTSALNRRFPPEERIEIVELLWEVVYADGEAHHYETSLMRRLAGLLYVDDRDVGAARKRVMARRAAQA